MLHNIISIDKLKSIITFTSTNQISIMKTIIDYELQIHDVTLKKDVVATEYSIVDDYGVANVKRTMSTEPLLNWVSDNIDCTDAIHYLSDNLFTVVKSYLEENL